MSIFGGLIPWSRKVPATVPTAQDVEKALDGTPPRAITVSSWFGGILEAFPGAWQRNIVTDDRESMLRFSAVYACIARISHDISVMRPMLMVVNNGIWEEAEEGPGEHPILSLFRKPNRYQTWVQFFSYWMTTKLMYGNAYIMKERDDRNLTRALYVLDPRLVTPLVTPLGDVYYQLASDILSGLKTGITIPAREMIHDRMNSLFHPLVGTTPLYANGYSATQARRIQENAQQFFANMSRPSGQLTAPGKITKETAERLKAEFEAEFQGSNIGRLFVSGDGLKYEPMAIPFEDAQMIQQLEWTVADICRSFEIPPYKVGAANMPTHANVAALNQEYLNQCLLSHIESIEALMLEGLELKKPYKFQLETENLLRLDPKTMAEVDDIRIKSGVLSPNEARFKANYKPVTGGNSPYLQQQNYSLAALAKRDAKEDPFAKEPSPNTPTPTPQNGGQQEENQEASLEFMFWLGLLKAVENHAKQIS